MNSTEQSQEPIHPEYVTVERHVLQDNITLIDTKSVFLMGLAGLLMVHCLDKLDLLVHMRHDQGLHFPLVMEISLGCYAVALLAFFATAYFTWYVVKPRVTNTNDFVFWGSEVFLKNEADFVNTIETTTPFDFGLHFLRHLYVLARICRSKYAYFARATRSAEVALLAMVIAEVARYLASMNGMPS